MSARDWIIDEARPGWIDVSLRGEFRTNTKRIRVHRDVGFRVDSGGVTGWGDAYTMEPDEAARALSGLRLAGRDLWDFDAILEPVAHRAARSALDVALHDALARRLEIPVHRLLGLPSACPVTSVSLSVGEEAEVLRRSLEWVARGFTCLKLKMATQTDPGLPARIRDVVGTAVGIRVDGNQAWTLEEAREVFPRLRDAGVEFCEQPFPVGRSELCAEIARETGLPIFLDEEITGPADVARVWKHGGVAGVNVKLSKCGGLRRSMETIRVARSLGMRVMIGCFFETSQAVGAAVHLAALADTVDLDAPLFLESDPFRGLAYEAGRARVEGPGTGVVPRAAPFS